MSRESEIGAKYGKSINDFSTASTNIIEDILIQHCNEGIDLMRKQIWKKAKTGQASDLAQSLQIKPKEVTPTKVTISTVSDMVYWEFVDKGVKGVKNKNKAPQSPYRFRNLGTPPAMVDSFKKWIARTGMKTVVIGGKRKSLYKKNKKTGEKTARLDRVEQAAQTLAVRTKIGGIKPIDYVSKANNPKRNKELTRKLRQGLASGIRQNINISIYGNNSRIKPKR
jgi:hypothetical protein